MKLTRIPGIEASVKQSLTFKQSTLDLLNEYLEICSEQTGAQVSFRFMVEQMLLDFMAEDKEFQKLRKDRKNASGKRSHKTQAAQETKPSDKAPTNAAAPVSATTAPASVSGEASTGMAASTGTSSLLDRFKGN